MEETVIVIMLKDEETGFLKKELGCYKLEENQNFIYNTYALKNDDGYSVFMKITTDREVEDWEFDAIYDYYDTETLKPYVTSINEDDDCYNPTWVISFDFIDNEEEMEQKISNLLSLHKKELYSVYEAIEDKKDEYINNEE